MKISITEENLGSRDIFCDYSSLLDDLEIGDIIRIDSGLFDVEVVEIGGGYCICKTLSSGIIGSYRHINLPGKRIKLPALTEQDKQDALF